MSTHVQCREYMHDGHEDTGECMPIIHTKQIFNKEVKNHTKR